MASDAHTTASEEEHEHHLAHIAPIKVLISVWVALLVLTVLTTIAGGIDFGGDLNLIVAMAIAIVKGSLVLLFFMHLIYDRRFHGLLFVAGLLFAFLFVSFALMDSSQYQHAIIWGHQAAAQAAPK